MRASCFSVLLLLLGSIFSIHATTAKRMDLDQLVSGAQEIVVGKVRDSETSWSGDGRLILTRHRIEVSETLKGVNDGSVEITTIGGTIGDLTLYVAGMPVFEPGQQWARLVSEIFGLSRFDGWIELEASENSLRAYTATGANDLSEFDGASPAVPATDFFFFHSGGSAILLNPSSQSVTATITNLDTQQSSPLDIPPRSRRTTPLAAPVRITAPTPIAGVERFGTDGNLGLGASVAESGSSLIFPHAVVGGGYRSWLSLANASSAPSQASITFASRISSFHFAGRSARRVSLGELLSVTASEIETGAVRVDATALFGAGNVAAVIDIETDQSVVTIAPVREATKIVFPHVANENGFFTGIAIAASGLAAEVTIEVFDASGMQSGSGVVSVPANGHVARLLSEFIAGFGNQSGGYIRLTSDQPVAAWEIYGTAAAMASGPPL
jgi:hypothetical protein